MKLILPLALALLLVACGSNESLLDQFEVDFIGDPAFRSCSDYYPIAIDDGTVMFLTSQNIVYTADNFNTFSGVNFDIGACGEPFGPFREIMYFDPQNIIALKDEPFNIPELWLWTDQSESFKLMYPDMTFTEWTDQVLSKFFVPNPELAWVARLEDQWSGEISFIEIKAGAMSVKSSFIAPEMTPKSIHFKNSNYGIMILGDNTGHYETSTSFFSYYTTDGGNTWLEEGFIGNEPIREVVFAESHVFARADLAIYQKPIDQPTWEISFSSDSLLQNLESYNNVLWLAQKKDVDEFGEIGIIHQSLDNGATWKQISDSLYVEYLSFGSETYGVAASNQVMQVTQDGGKTWSPKLMPLHP